MVAIAFHSRRLAALLAAACLPSAALASGLQVEPVSVVISERSNVIWLSNTSAVPLQAQVRVYRWVQAADGERFDPTDTVLASPPMVRIAPGERQLVRLVSAGAGSCEDGYRLMIDEIPRAVPKGTGLRYVLHYSVPVFVTSRACANVAPELTWQFESVDAGVRLVVANSGNMHAQLAQIAYVDTHGKRIELTPGLLGYVLPGVERSFVFSVNAAALASSGSLEVLVNGNRVNQPIALAAPAR